MNIIIIILFFILIILLVSIISINGLTSNCMQYYGGTKIAEINKRIADLEAQKEELTIQLQKDTERISMRISEINKKYVNSPETEKSIILERIKQLEKDNDPLIQTISEYDQKINKLRAELAIEIEKEKIQYKSFLPEDELKYIRSDVYDELVKQKLQLIEKEKKQPSTSEDIKECEQLIESLIEQQPITDEDIEECQQFIQKTRPIKSDIEHFEYNEELAKLSIYTSITCVLEFANLFVRIALPIRFKQLNLIIDKLGTAFDKEIWYALLHDGEQLDIYYFIGQYIEQYNKAHRKNPIDGEKFTSEISTIIPPLEEPAVVPQLEKPAVVTHKISNILFSFLQKGTWSCDGMKYLVIQVESESEPDPDPELEPEPVKPNKRFWVYYSDKLEIGIWRLLSVVVNNEELKIYSGNNYETYEKTFINMELQVELDRFTEDDRILYEDIYDDIYDDISEDIYEGLPKYYKWEDIAIPDEEINMLKDVGKIIDGTEIDRVDDILFKHIPNSSYNPDYGLPSRKNIITSINNELNFYENQSECTYICESTVYMQSGICVNKKIFKCKYNKRRIARSLIIYVAKITIVGNGITNTVPYFISIFDDSSSDFSDDNMWGVYSQYVRLPCNIYDLFCYSDKLGDHQYCISNKTISYSNDNIVIAEGITYIGDKLYSNYFSNFTLLHR